MQVLEGERRQLPPRLDELVDLRLAAGENQRHQAPRHRVQRPVVDRLQIIHPSHLDVDEGLLARAQFRLQRTNLIDRLLHLLQVLLARREEALAEPRPIQPLDVVEEVEGVLRGTLDWRDDDRVQLIVETHEVWLQRIVVTEIQGVTTVQGDCCLNTSSCEYVSSSSDEGLSTPRSCPSYHWSRDTKGALTTKTTNSYELLMVSNGAVIPKSVHASA